jgi:hypothetical protein
MPLTRIDLIEMTTVGDISDGALAPNEEARCPPITTAAKKRALS